MKLILDTDIGSDIDDAVCLAYLLAQPRCKLLGITTVSGEPERRAAMASALCHAAGRPDIPIFPGAESPLVVPQRQPECTQASALERWPHSTRFAPNQAVTFMAETILKHPGEVTLLAIGPMTNVALLFATYPEVMPKLKELVMMIGRFQELGTEWNAKCDPDAADLVYRSKLPRCRSIGLDVTLQVTMPAEEVRRRFQWPLLRTVLDFAEVWFAHSKTITFHDPLAAAILFDEQICEFERGTVTVDFEPELPAVSGLTRWQADVKGQHEVATTVNADRFFSHYFKAFQEWVAHQRT